MRHNSWQDGVLGTNCPIPQTWNWTYQFQVKDQVGSYFYYPSLNLQRASGGFGPIIINNRDIIPIPFAQPDGDIILMIGDWYTRNHTVSFICSSFCICTWCELMYLLHSICSFPYLLAKSWPLRIRNDDVSQALRAALDAGKDLGMPDGVLINGKGPFRYNSTLVPDGLAYETVTVDPGNLLLVPTIWYIVICAICFRFPSLLQTKSNFLAKSVVPFFIVGKIRFDAGIYSLWGSSASWTRNNWCRLFIYDNDCVSCLNILTAKCWDRFCRSWNVN